MTQLNYENVNAAGGTHTVEASPTTYDTSGVNPLSTPAPPNSQPVDYVNLYENPSNSSNILNLLAPSTPVTVLREWATGNNKWAYIAVDQGSGIQNGYILTQHLKANSSYQSKILPKATIELQSMTPLELALVPHKSWMGLDAPFYHQANGEWWFSVTLPYTCIEDGTLEAKKQEAKVQAISEMYEYFDINPSDNVPTQEEFLNGLQSSYTKDYFLETRPGAELMMLVIMPAVYIQYLKENTAETEIEDVNENYCVTIRANTKSDLDDVQQDIVSCLVKQYQSYLNSNVEVTNFNFENEIFKQTEGITQIKFLLNENDIDLDSIENQTTSPDACVTAPEFKKIKVCFDEEYMLKAVYYYNNKGEKKLLSSGLSLVKNSFPFNEKRFGSLFLNHKKICSQPELKLKTFFEEYVVDPKPEFKVVTYNTRTPKNLSPYSTKELGAYVDTALFLTSLAKQFGNVFDLNKAGAGNIGYNCYSSNKAVDAFKLKALDYRDSQFLFSGDIMAFFQWVCNLKFSDAEEAVLKAGIGIGDFGWEWLLGDEDVWRPLFSIRFSEFRIPSFSLIGAIKEGSERAFKLAIDKLITELIKFFLKIKCELLLAGITSLAALAAGVGVASYFASQGKSNKLGDDVSALPSPAELSIRDYGGENCNDILKESIGSNDEDYNQHLLEIFARCGVLVPQQNLNLPKQYLDAISSVTAPVELLSLLEGSASNSLINFILKYTKKEFPSVYGYKNTSSKIATFFACLGENTTQESVDKAKEKIQEKINDEEFCFNLAEALKDIMKDKCPTPEVFESVYNKEFSSSIETYQELISLLEDECNSINISLFNNPETGEKGILNVLSGKVKGEQKLLENLSEVLLGSSKIVAQGEAGILYTQESPSYPNSLASVVDVFSKPVFNDLVDHNPKEGSNTATRYRHKVSSNDTFPLEYRLEENGGLTVSWTSKIGLEEKTATVEPFSISPEVQSIIKPGSNSWPSQISKQQKIFYSLVDEYFDKNTKDGFGTPFSAPAPLGITSALSSEEKDEVFPAILSSFMTTYAKKVASQWEGDQFDVLNSYSKAMAGNIANIINYDQAKNELQKGFNPADYDDPNDATTISPKQYGMFNSLFYAYVRLAIFEYFALSMPFYEVFNFGSPEKEFKFAQFYPEVAKDYIKSTINNDLNELTGSPVKYNSYFNQTYDFVKQKSDFQVKEYSGNSRGLDFYIDSNFKSVFNKFEEALDEVSSTYKKQKSWVETGSFIFDRKKALQVHNYAGLKNLFDENQLSGEKIFTSQTDEEYSLFAFDRYDKFKNGMFFIQNYVYIEDKETSYQINERKEYLKGALNLNHLNQIDDEMIDSLKSSPLKTVFKTVKYGSRLCYGIAVKGSSYWGGASNDPQQPGGPDFDVIMAAEEIFENYQKDGFYKNNDKLSSSNRSSAAKSFPLQKYMVCVDGPILDFLRKKGPGDWVQTSSGYFNPDEEYQYTNNKTYSIVIPIFNKEEEVDMDQSWNQLLASVSNPDWSNNSQFKNLNEDLINSGTYEALVESCFSIKNMIHFNALFGLIKNDIGSVENFSLTRRLLITNIKNVAAAKDVT